MPGSNVTAGDELIRRLETELHEKESFVNEVFRRAQDSNRDLSEEDKTMVAEQRGRMEQIKSQLETIEDVTRVSYDSRTRAIQVGQAIETLRGKKVGRDVEYRSAGMYIQDLWNSSQGSRDAGDRLEMFHRAAEHQRTPDNPGLIPDPIIGPVLDFIDAARPLVSLLGPKPLPGAAWHRPIVKQHTRVDVQGAAGKVFGNHCDEDDDSDEKTELVSQKLKIGRITGEAKTIGGYVNVSRQNIDFSNPAVFDIIISDLANQYAIKTEQLAAGAVAENADADPVEYDTSDPTTAQQSLAKAIWNAAGQVYKAAPGRSQVLVVAPDVLGNFGPLFAPYGPFNQHGQGFSANNFGQGVAGTISGISVVMSTGLEDGTAFLLSTAAIEVYEQRIGTLQVTEPSVLGIQVAYAGYFEPLVIRKEAIIPLEAAA